MGFQTLSARTVLYFDDFIGQLGAYQFHSSGTINRLWRASSGTNGVAQFQANAGYNSARHNPNSLYIFNSREFVLSGSLAIIRSTGTQLHYFGLIDKHLGELPVANGFYIQGDTSTGNWRGLLYRNGVLLDSKTITTIAANETFQTVTISSYNGQTKISIDNSSITLTGQTDFAAGFLFGLSNTGTSFPSILIDWVKLEA